MKYAPALAFALAACSDDAPLPPPSSTGVVGATVGAGGAGGAGSPLPVDCAAGERLGPPDGAVGLTTAEGTAFNVRVPSSYQPTVAHPLIVTFSPRVQDDTPEALEAFTGLAPDALARGYLIAFVEWFDPVDASLRQDADTIRERIAAEWCIDPARVYYTGHSDGGSMSTLLPFLHDAPVAAVAPSAAGIEGGAGAFLGCDDAVPALVIHSADDEVFPVPPHGPGHADHYASCLGCGAPGGLDDDGCVTYPDCPVGAEVLYCETTGDHYAWYGLNDVMLDFFDRHRQPPP